MKCNEEKKIHIIFYSSFDFLFVISALLCVYVFNVDRTELALFEFLHRTPSSRFHPVTRAIDPSSLDDNYNKWFRMVLESCVCLSHCCSVRVWAEWIQSCLFFFGLLNAFVSFCWFSSRSPNKSCSVLAHLWFHQFEFNDIRVESNTYGN